MTTDPDLAERAFQAGRAGAEKPRAHGELEKRVVNSFYAAGQRAALAEVPAPGSVEEWRRREGRVVEDCTRALYGTTGPEQQGMDVPHDPGG